MGKVTFKTKESGSEYVGDTLVTGNGSYITTDLSGYIKYLNDDRNKQLSDSGGSEAWHNAAQNNTAHGTASKPTAAPESSGSKKPQSGTGYAVAIRDYAAANGFPGVVDWDGEKVTVGGKAIEPLYVIDGTAYIQQGIADTALNDIADAAGLHSRDYAQKQYEDKYGKALDAALDAVLDREKFTYNPAADDVYNAYRTQYEREANNAYRKVLNDNNTSVTGASGAVLSEALAARGEYLSKMTDMIPQLAADAYERYSGERTRMTNALKLLNDIAEDYYSRLYQNERDKYSDLLAAAAAENKIKQQDHENYRIDEQNRIANERNRVNDEHSNAQKDANTAKINMETRYYPAQFASELNSEKVRTEGYALDNAITRGFFTRSDESVLPWLSSYRTSSGYSINPQLAAAAYEYDKAYSKKRGDIAAQWGW